MRVPWSAFTTGLILFGALLTSVVAADLARRGLRRNPVHPQWPLGDADAVRGRELIAERGCGACHVIPGVRRARGRVGPKLDDYASQMYIAGVLANTPENLALWLRDPAGVNPRTVMPDLGLSEAEARDMVAYLYSLR